MSSSVSRDQSPFSKGSCSQTASPIDTPYDSDTSEETHFREEKRAFFDDEKLKELNAELEGSHPEKIIQWAHDNIPGLVQISAFGMTGMLTMHMMADKVGGTGQRFNVIFIDTLYHFKETIELVERTKQRYPELTFNVIKPEGAETVEQFEERYGKELWCQTGYKYDVKVKKEPQLRAYQQFDVRAVFTGRRRSQGESRSDLRIVESSDGIININPFAEWTWEQIMEYAKANDVPYNSLIDQGYKSVGDWHSTKKPREGEGERSGRWEGSGKTECGLHNLDSKFVRMLKEQEARERREAEMASELSSQLEEVEGRVSRL